MLEYCKKIWKSNISSQNRNERCTSDLFIRKSRTGDAHRICSFGNPERKIHIGFVHSEIPNKRCTSDLFVRKSRTRDAHRICSFGNPEQEMHIGFVYSEKIYWEI
ncbi:MAG: hypothetical protein LBP63_11425 [Prevotellaceae bacterium]|nr:hypothetical protein [Prevotellaceae bacterium]